MYTVYSVHCTLYSVQFTVYSVQIRIYIVHGYLIMFYSMYNETTLMATTKQVKVQYHRTQRSLRIQALVRLVCRPKFSLRHENFTSPFHYVHMLVIYLYIIVYIHCIVYSVYYRLYTIQFVQCTVFIIHCTMYNAHCIVYKQPPPRIPSSIKLTRIL